MYNGYQRYNEGYVPHPGAATYYYQEPVPCVPYSAPGAVGGLDFYRTQSNEFFNLYNENKSGHLSEQQAEVGNAMSSSSDQKRDEQPLPNGKKEMRGYKEEAFDHREVRQKKYTDYNYRGGYRGNQRSHQSSQNYVKTESKENSQRYNKNNSGKNYASDSQLNNNVVYGQGYYKKQYINKVRNLRAERQQNDQSSTQEPSNKENFLSQRGTSRHFKSLGKDNRRQYFKDNNRGNKPPNTNICEPNSYKYNKYLGKRGHINSGRLSMPNDEEEKTIQFRNGTYECNVCMDKIAQKDPIWSCQICFNSFHLSCVTSWIENCMRDERWRCPACNSEQLEKSVKYVCFCKKVSNPYWNRKETPHSCGQLCKKKRNPSWCVHGCPNLCHPGACPPCAAFIKRKCACGKLEKSLRCSDGQDLICDNSCDKLLNCGVHHCKNQCHMKECQFCDKTIEKTCYCGKSKNMEVCTEETASDRHYSCKEMCGKMLSCDMHTCQKICHSGECMSCDREVSVVTHCPCGKKNLNEMEGPVRKSCSDPIQNCGKICGKTLKCGNPGNFHTCAVSCHEGACPPCLKVTPVKCRCGGMNENIQCVELRVKADEVTCKKACKKLRHCGRHKCGMKCCIDQEHLCIRKCSLFLTCKSHRCEDLCHRGKCKRCLRSSFDELTCHCGYSSMDPPIPCGTEPPMCDQPCVRIQSCAHLQTHKCHQGSCPPCTILVSKPCCGNHKTIKITPCYVSSLSCGSLCGKILSCTVHKCQKVCHEGVCETDKKCIQICQKPRQSCGHACGAKCHRKQCPMTDCKVIITIRCICGTRKSTIQCSQNEKEFSAMVAARLASKVQNTGETVDLSALLSGNNENKMKRLECDDECKLKQRNQQLALALQISNPESRETLGDSTHLYSDLLKEDAKRDLQFTSMVHDQLNDLVMRARQSTQKNRSYSFVPMNRDKRRFIHEYSKHFGCESKAYDEEPKKNVVVTASKGFCFLPPVSVLTIVQRESGNRKAPGPYLSKIPKSATEKSFKKLEKSFSQEKRDEEAQSASKPFDYFDME